MQNYASLQDTHDNEEQGIVFHAEPTRSRWNHIEDLDSFFTRMYKYHQKHGFLCMLLQEIFQLNQFIFIIVLTLYLWHGIDYKALFRTDSTPLSKKVTLSDVIYPLHRCIANFHVLTWFILVIAMAVLMFKFLIKVFQLNQYWDIKQFFNTALNIEDKELDNLTWHDVLIRIKEVQLEQQMCIHKRELTELDIYHRILRQENYMIAMTNKHLLPPRLNPPCLGERIYWTKPLRYNIQGLLFWSPWSPFENPWHLREEYKRQNLRQELASQLRKYILWLALVNFIFAPIILIWQVVYTFFSYAELIKREPGKIGIRSWSRYGKMFLRHFNELDHELKSRLNRASQPANKYMEAFSSPLLTIVAQHVAFICGALFAVLVCLMVYDEDVIAVEHLLTLMTVLGVMIPTCRALIPDEATIWCPEQLLYDILKHTHYLPANWQGLAHTSRVRWEFEQLFQYRFITLLEELLSPIMTPYLLVRWVYPRSLEIVDFFRNFTVSVVGVGDVCSFAQLDVKKHGSPEWHRMEDSVAPGTAKDQYSQGEDGKVEMSLVHFASTNPSWEPPPESKEYVDFVEGERLSRMSDDFDSFQKMLETTPSLPFKKSAMAKSTGMLRKSIRMMEGPTEDSRANMMTSAVVMHNIQHRNRSNMNQSMEETTPLLISKPNH